MRFHVQAAVRALLIFLLGLIPASSLFAAYTVTGKFEYEDREFDLDGFTGVVTRRAIRFADVRILAAGSSVARGATNAAGEFMIVVPDIVVSSLSAICITSSSETPTLLLNVRVADNNFSFGDFYSISSATFATQGPSGIISMGTTVAKAGTDPGKAFNIWDVLLDGLEFVSSAQAHGSLPDQPLTALWRETHTRTGSFFNYGNNRYIYVGSFSGCNDTVIAHEFAHFIDAAFSRSYNPGGQHFLGDDKQDIRLSWAEGLATFLGSSIRRFKGYPRPDIYVSTDGVNLSFSYELESLSGNANIASTTGSTNEVAVSAALWDITDGTNTADADPGADDDPLERPFHEVWKDLTQYMPSVTGHDPSVEDFWDGWFAVRNGGSLIDMQRVFADVNGIEFLPDPLEADDAFAEASRIGVGRIEPLVAERKVLISEINVDRVDAVELYNAGNREVDLAGWRIIAGAPGYSTAVLTLPPFRLAAGAFVVLSEASGVNTSSTLFFSNNISWANGSDGDCALLDNWGVGKDFVRWGNSNAIPPVGTAFFGANPASPASGKTLCRSFGARDTDSGIDWSGQSPSLATYNMGGNALHHTFYPSLDIDIAVFHAAAGAEYLVETFHLTNGAQTTFDIVAADGATTLASSGNPSNQTSGSSLRWTASVSGQYYVRTRRFDGGGNLARYGSYDLRVVARAPLRVSKGPEGQFDTLAAAIAAALPGDTIEIQDSSTYLESLVIAGKNITLRAARGQRPVLDASADSSRPGVDVNAPSVRMEGLIIRGGTPGIRVWGGSATLRNIIVTRAAAGIHIEGPSTAAALTHCTIAGNAGFGVRILQSASARIINTIAAGNPQGDLFSDGTAPSVIVGNSLVGSGAPAGSDGNLEGDPRFVNAGSGDYHLAKLSPAIDAGSPAEAGLPALDAGGLSRSLDGNGDGTPIPDMGAYEYLPSESLASVSLFPQIAVGGGYRTSLVAINPGKTEAQIRLNLSGSDGRPVSEALLTTAGTYPALSLPALGMTRMDAESQGEITSGYASLLGSIPINGAVIFQVLDGNRIAGEAGVGPASPAARFIIYVDDTNNARSGYALANPGALAAHATLILRDPGGSAVASEPVHLAARGHLAEFAWERFAAAGSGFEGTIECVSDQPLHAVALRYDNTTQDVFSTIPVLTDSLSSTLYFPQIADGSAYRTNLILLNPNDRPVTAQIDFFTGTGESLRLPVGGVLRAGMSVSLGPRGSASLFTDGSDSVLKTGWTRVTANDAIGGSSIIQTLSGTRVTAEAGTAASAPGSRLLSHMESRGHSASGIAICNPGANANPLTLRLRNTLGEIVAARSLVLPGLGQTARFFTEWFTPGFDEFEGTLEIRAAGPVSVVALRFDNLLLDVFATLPVIVIQ